MDIKATKLQNTQATQQASATTVLKPAEKTADGKSFIDEMVSLPSLDNANNNTQKVAQNQTKEVPQNKETNSKQFEFVSTSNEFSKTLNNKETQQAVNRQTQHKIAEKELVDEIVLMNNKNSEVKNAKTELKTAQASVGVKSDNQIEEEKQETKQLANNFENTNILKNLNDFNQNEQTDIKQSNQQPEIEQNTVDKTETKPLALMAEKEEINISENFVEPEVFEKPVQEETFEAPQKLEIVDNSQKEITMPEKIEVFDAPQDLKMVNKFDNQETLNTVADKTLNEKVTSKQIDNVEVLDTVENKVQNNKLEQKQFEKVMQQPVEKAEVKNVVADKVQNDKLMQQPVEKTEVKNIVADKVQNDKLMQQPIEKTEVKNVVADKVQNEKLMQQPVEKTEVKNIVADKVQNENVMTKQTENIEVLGTVAQAEVSDFTEKVNNFKSSQIVNDLQSTTVDKKSVINNAKTIAQDIMQEAQKVDAVKDTVQSAEVKAVDTTSSQAQNMTVIRFEPITNPLEEINKVSSNSNSQALDIVNFIDANLSTEKSKKTAKSSATSNVEKKASEKAIKMTEQDAKFFNSLIENNQQVMEGTKVADTQNQALFKDVEQAQSTEVSKTLLNALKESQEKNKSFRVDFDKDLSVILKVNKDGGISAEFLPGDKAVEQYLKANIPLLKQKFEDEGLNYENLSYRQQKNKDERRQQGNKKENGYE